MINETDIQCPCSSKRGSIGILGMFDWRWSFMISEADINGPRSSTCGSIGILGVFSLPFN